MSITEPSTKAELGSKNGLSATGGFLAGESGVEMMFLLAKNASEWAKCSTHLSSGSRNIVGWTESGTSCAKDTFLTLLLFHRQTTVMSFGSINIPHFL